LTPKKIAERALSAADEKPRLKPDQRLDRCLQRFGIKDPSSDNEVYGIYLPLSEWMSLINDITAERTVQAQRVEALEKAIAKTLERIEGQIQYDDAQLEGMRTTGVWEAWREDRYKGEKAGLIIAKDFLKQEAATRGEATE